MKNAKRIVALFSSLLLTITLILSLASCGGLDTAKLWENATYQSDSTVGEGETALSLTVRVGDNSVKLTVLTDKSTVGEALLDANIISGDMEDYGLYIKTVNGIRADYDLDKAYWAFYINGEYAISGVDSTEIVEGEAYELVYSK